MLDTLAIVVVLGLILYAAMNYLPSLAKSVPTSVPTPRTGAADVPAQSSKPRWHKFDVLLELQECLIKSGCDEKQVAAICEPIASLLLGSQK